MMRFKGETMTKEALDKQLMELPGVTKDYKAEWGWDRYMVGGKMFAALCQPGAEHAAEYAGHPLLTLKCDPLESESLRREFPDILHGFYMNKANWISIRLDGEVPDELASTLSAKSHALIFAKLTKKRQAEILGESKLQR